MLRQRLRSRTSPLALLARALVVLFALALIWAGLVIFLLALGVGDATVDSITGYRAAFDSLAGLESEDVDDATTRAIVAGAGVLAFLVFGYLALRELPRPYLARQDLELSKGHDGQGEERTTPGTLTVAPRAIERLAETAAEDQPGVAGASGRYGTNELAVGVAVRRAGEVAATLGGVQTAVHDALSRHGVPDMTVSVILTGYEPKTKRELN
ncbi:MAG: hypothetical protein H0U25_02030 [Thermoleophilaceae bacterium]|nr:hypothetical protein [Thermoleophilaceae bacterium]